MNAKHGDLLLFLYDCKFIYVRQSPARHQSPVDTNKVHRPTLLLRRGKALRPGLSSTMASSAQDRCAVPGTKEKVPCARNV